MALCECGCGKATRIASQTSRRDGHIRGLPVRFVRGHNRANRGRAKLDGYMRSDGYKRIYVGYEHPMADCQGYAYVHRLVMAEAIGRPLRREEQVHHVNGVKHDNRLDNLMLFASHAEHMRHHAKEKQHV